MNRGIVLSLATALLYLPVYAQEAPADWIAASNQYTNQLLAVEMKHTPELGSNEGLSQFDTEVSQPTLADEDQERRETEAVVATFKSAVAQQKQKEVAQDLQIMIRTVELQFREVGFLAGTQGGFPERKPEPSFAGCGFCWTNRRLRNGGPRRWSAFANMPGWNRDTSRWPKF